MSSGLAPLFLFGGILAGGLHPLLTVIIWGIAICIELSSTKDKRKADKERRIQKKAAEKKYKEKRNDEFQKVRQEIRNVKDFQEFRSVYQKHILWARDLEQTISDYPTLTEYRVMFTKEKLEEQYSERKEAKAAIQLAALSGQQPRKKYTYSTYIESSWWKRKAKRTKEYLNGRCEFCCTEGHQVHHRVYPKPFGTETIKHLILVCGRCHKICHGQIAQPYKKKCLFCEKEPTEQVKVIQLTKDTIAEELYACAKCANIFNGARQEAYDWSAEYTVEWFNAWGKPNEPQPAISELKNKDDQFIDQQDYSDYLYGGFGNYDDYEDDSRNILSKKNSEDNSPLDYEDYVNSFNCSDEEGDHEDDYEDDYLIEDRTAPESETDIFDDRMDVADSFDRSNEEGWYYADDDETPDFLSYKPRFYGD